MAFLRELKVEVDPVQFKLQTALTRPRSTSKLKKWNCSPGCTNIWAAVGVAARCHKCGHDFARSLVTRFAYS
jgi:hypothetical protein